MAAGGVRDRADANVAAARLHAEGIEAFVAADDVGGTHPGIDLGRVRVMVRAADRAHAQRILDPAK